MEINRVYFQPSPNVHPVVNAEQARTILEAIRWANQPTEGIHSFYFYNWVDGVPIPCRGGEKAMAQTNTEAISLI